MKNIFEKPKQQPNEEGDLNEIKRELKLINSKTPEENKENNPPTKEEIEEVVEKLNQELGL